MQAKTGTIDSHTVVSQDANTIKGTMVLSNCNHEAVSQSKDTLSKQLTQKVQSDSQNSKSQVQVNDVKKSPDGTLSLTYQCSGVSDHDTAKKTLNNACQHDDVKQTIVKATQNDAPASVTPKQQTVNVPSKSTGPQQFK